MDLLLSSPPLLAGLALAALFYYHVRVFSFWSSRNISGPTPWPFFGTNIYYVFRNKLQVDREWRQRYGHTYGIYEGYQPTLRTTDNEPIKRVFIKEFNNFTDRNSKLVFSEAQRKWLLWSPGKYWSNQRALVSPMFTSSRMRSMFKSMSQCMDAFLENVIEKKLERQKVLGKSDVSLLTLDVIAHSFFSLKLDLYQSKASEFLRQAFKLAAFDVPYFIVWSLIPSPVLAYLQLDLFRQSRMEYFRRLSQGIIAERRRTVSASDNAATGEGATPKKNDFIQALLDAKLSSAQQYEKVFSQEDDLVKHYNNEIGHEELERINERQTKEAFMKSFGEAEIIGQMTFLMIAGFETTAQTLTFAIYELAHRQADQARLFDELRRELTAKGADRVAAGQSLIKSIDYGDLINLKLLDAFLSEVLRLYAPIVEHNRMVTRAGGLELATERGPVWLPERTAISVNGFVLQRDPAYWPQPDTFDMERFLPENRDKIAPCSYMPFGLGPRNCAGMRFALMELKLALARLLFGYTIAPGPTTGKYPPAFLKNPVFLQMSATDFRLERRVID